MLTVTGSTEYLHIPLVGDLPQEVSVAVTPVGTVPTEAQWVPAEVLETASGYEARILHASAVAGDFTIYVRLRDDPETVVRDVGLLRVT